MMTMMPLTKADSFVPRISSSVSNSRMTTAGMFMMPVHAGAAAVSNGECDHWYGMSHAKPVEHAC